MVAFVQTTMAIDCQNVGNAAYNSARANGASVSTATKIKNATVASCEAEKKKDVVAEKTNTLQAQ